MWWCCGAALQEEVESGERAHSYTTARTLLSVIRLSEGLARLRFADAVAQSDVDEALRLMKMSKASLGDPQQHRRKGKDVDPITEIYQILRAFAATNDKLHVEAHEARAIASFLGGAVRAFVWRLACCAPGAPEPERAADAALLLCR